MTVGPWQLENHNAHLRQSPISARLDLLHPAEGLRLDQSGQPPDVFAEAQLLGVEVPSCASGEPDLVIEKYVRGHDLVVAYRQTEAWPVQVDAMWRAVSGAPLGRLVAAMELVVSVRTQQLDSRPELVVRTALVADQVLRMADAGASRFRPLSAGRSSALGPGEGPGCLLFRREGGRLSYAEMIHPADFDRDELTIGTASSSGRDPLGPAVRLRHRLFPQSLEKGVILRARLRGVFCPRELDAGIVAETYRAFAAADPPLGSP